MTPALNIKIYFKRFFIVRHAQTSLAANVEKKSPKLNI